MPDTIKRGRLTDAERARIIELAEGGASSCAIARELNRHQSSVGWLLYSEGLRAPKPAENPKPYQRGGVTVQRFSAEEDAFIEALRTQEYSVSKIAELSSKRFEIRRTAHAVRCRLVMLAAREEAAA